MIKKEIEREYLIIQSLFSLTSRKRLELSSRIYNYDFLSYLRKTNSQKFHYPVSDSTMIDIINHTKINLGFLEVYTNNNYQLVEQHLHLREFEIPMCRGLYLTNFSDELFYEPYRELIMFHNEHELIHKVRYFLQQPEKAERIRQAGYLRAKNCHTYQKRFTDLFEKLKLLRK
jgi:spore maturation protein CgeB